MQSSECGAVSVLLECFGSVCHEDVESEAAHAREHAWVGSDASPVLAHGNVTAVVAGGPDGSRIASNRGSDSMLVQFGRIMTGIQSVDADH